MEVRQKIVSLLCLGKVSMMNSCLLHQNVMPALKPGPDMRPRELPNLMSSWHLSPSLSLKSFPLALDHHLGQGGSDPSSPSSPRRQIARLPFAQGGSWMATLPTFVSTTVQFSAIAIARKPSISLVFCHNGGRRPEVHFVAGLKHIVCSL